MLLTKGKPVTLTCTFLIKLVFCAFFIMLVSEKILVRVHLSRKILVSAYGVPKLLLF